MTTAKPAEEKPSVAEQSAEIGLAAENIIKNHVITAAGVSLIPIPAFDMAALTATQLNLLRSLSEHFEVPFNDTDVKTIVTPMLSSCLPVLGLMGLSSFAKLIPGIGTLVGSASLSVTSGAVTYAIGQVFARHFAAGGNLENFDSEQAKQVMSVEIERGKAFVRAIKDEINPSDYVEDEKQPTTENPKP